MSGGIVQLVATGIQDVNLTGNPEISFFRSAYKRHTHFAMNVSEQIIQGTPSAGTISTIKFERKGDLLSYVYLTRRDATNISQATDWGSLIDRVDLLIGGQIIDTQDVYFSNTISPLYMSSTYSTRFNPTGSTTFFPLQFFFCKDFQSALPLVALQFHEVEIRITWKAAPTGSIRAWANFIYLDKEEREFFATKSHDMIMYQVQRVLFAGNYMQEPVFNHPVKFIAFPCKAYTAANQTLRLQINGVDMSVDKALIQYSQVSAYYHTQYAFSTLSGDGYPTTALIPFCLDTSKLQPTGTLNFSRIDTFRLITNNGTTLANGIYDNAPTKFMYGVNYNVLRISNGMAGLLYAN